MPRHTKSMNWWAILVAGVLVTVGLMPLVHADANYESLAAQVDMNRLVKDLRTFEAMGSRVVGYPGNAAAADRILAEFQALGLDTMVQEYNLPTPYDAGSDLVIAGRNYEVSALWPNHSRTSQVPVKGLSGPVIYVGRGNLSDFNGQNTSGAIVLMDFNTQQNWLNAGLLDAAAVVFIEPTNMTRGEAEMKFVRAPINVPRFYVRGEDAAGVLAAVSQGSTTGTIRSREPIAWRDTTNRNVLGIMPGRDPELKSEAIIIEAYYDSVSIVPRLAPGAENAIGVAYLLELARLLKANPPARTVIFMACSGHFQALSGAREFTALWGREPRKERNREDHLRVLQTQLAKLEGDKSSLQNDLVKLEEQRLSSEGGKGRFKNVVNIGQLEISPEAAGQRLERLDVEIQRKQNDIEIWQKLDGVGRIELFVSLDLSSRSRQVGPFQSGFYYNQSHLLRFYSPLGKQLGDYADAAAEALGYNTSDVYVDGINPVKGREWHTFFPGKVAFDHEMVIRGGRPAIVFATVNDGRPLVDTPLDTVANLDIDNLTIQTRLLSGVLANFLNDDTLKQKALKRIQALKKMDDLKDIHGTILEFRRRDSFVPNTPVPGSLVLVQGNYRMMMGVHTDVMTMANETSEFTLRGEMAAGVRDIEAYQFDASTGDIIYAPDRGPDGDKKYPRGVAGRSGLKRPVIVFRCSPTDVFDLVDNRYFQTLQKMFIYDAKNYSEPISFGYSLSSMGASAAEFPSYVEPTATIFSMPEVDLQVTMAMGLLGVRMVLINATEDAPTGKGFPAATTHRIPFTPLQIAQDMWRIDEFRMDKLRARGIRNSRLERLHEDAAEALQMAAGELEARRYDRAMSNARHAWGYESRAYPDVQKTAIDVVKGVLFYLAILLPFAYFGERLLIASRTVIGMIVGTLAVFLVVFLMLAAVHPAFTLTANPPIILLAFIIMALAVMVISIVTMKFNEQLKAMKQARGGVHEADVGRLSAAAAAFSLGIANMRRRKLRTGLTASTLILLTFTVLSFTSVREGLRTNEIRLPTTPTYEGVMLRDRAWLSLEEPTADILANELSGVGVVAPRAWFTSAQIDKELMVDVTSATDTNRKYVVSCLLGLAPEESQVMDIDRALVAGRFFKPGDKDVCLLPTTVAEGLGITTDHLGSAQVMVFGTRFRVIGLLSESHMRKMRDLDGEPMMPVNYAMLRPEVLAELQRQASQRSELGTSSAQSLLQEYKHFGPEKMVVLPYATTLELGGTLRSIAVRYHQPDEVLGSVRQMMKRFALSLYAGYRDDTYLFSSVGVTSFSGLEQLFIPILIAALIVLNTMLGSVHERVREIGIYSSLGLAPVHVSMLFLAEASVFANLGAIIGYLLGQVVTKVLYASGSMHGIELNYSSMSAVSVTVVVIIVVLLSTLYPSKKAGEIASPGIERKWSLPEPEADVLTVVLPFTVTGRDAWGVSAFLKEFFDEYVGYAGGEFLAEDVRLESITTDLGKGMQVALRMWLAPYDLGVSQDFRLNCEPTDDGDIFAIVIRLQRLAGDITSWKKTNTLFLAAIRKQFLIWRTVPQAEKEDYGTRAERILAGEEIDEPLNV